jgi:hypothetical protein
MAVRPKQHGDGARRQLQARKSDVKDSAKDAFTHAANFREWITVPVRTTRSI